MNFLAHAFLSFNDPGILVGNMISDFVKGKKQYDFDLKIQQGIKLHRQIDEFTDNHAATKKASAILKPIIGAYAGAFTDVVYDHFLAKDVHQFSDNSLHLLAANTYSILELHEPILPEKFVKMLPFMKQQNWLVNYSNITGIEKSFAGIARRAKFLDNSTKAYECFMNNYKSFEEYYHIFFPELKNQAMLYYNDLQTP